MRPPRGLSDPEKRAWARLAATVTPLDGRAVPHASANPVQPREAMLAAPALPKQAVKPAKTSPPKQPTLSEKGGTLDSSWDRKLSRAGIAPDFTLDLHGHTLDAAYERLNRGLAQAIAQGARVLLVVTGRPRPVAAADRGERRGAIRAKLLDWIAAGPHAGAVAAIRPAHPRHGGQGALYVVLRKTR